MKPLDLSKMWDEVLKLLKYELSEVSYNTWIEGICPVSLHNNLITFETTNDFTRSIVSSRYTPLIISAIKQVTSQEYLIDVILTENSSSIVNSAYSNKKTYVDTNHETDSILNPKYTFNTFVIGNSNRFAHAACLAVAETPAKSYNPLFLYGGVGLGKTHLMHAIGHFIQSQNRSSKVVYVTSEKFTNELINSIKDDRNIQFRNRYRNVDVLLIDDIQFIAGKERTQEEFFHTFNTLHESNKQIIISSDRPPKEIPTLEERLRSRFEWGLITDIQPPDFETRIAILKKKADMENIEIENEVMHFIAKMITSNIRELEGALIRIAAYSTLTNKNVDIELASEVLRDILPHAKPTKVDLKLIQDVTAKYFNLRLDDFKSKRRTRNLSFPRQIAMYLTRELTDMSLPKIGDEFGGRDHSTVIHAYDKISKEILKDNNLSNIIKELRATICGDN